MSSPYKSFWMGGFEGADHVNGKGDRLDTIRSSGHLDNLDEDYSRLAALGIRTVRESAGWRSCQPEIGSELNLNRVVSQVEAARRHGIQLIWSFMHYGTPEGVSLLNDAFIDQFASFAASVAATLEPLNEEPPVYNLINEISFLSWATSQTTSIWPYQGRNEGAGSEAAEEGFRTKRRLVKAVLDGVDAVKSISPDARFLHVEPLLHVVPPVDQPGLEELASEIREHQFQTWELLRGSMEPELGGHPEALDLMGVNYYYNGQMEINGQPLDWHEPDPRRLPFSELLTEAWERYKRPLIVAETGHFDDGREKWLQGVRNEIAITQTKGVPLEGVCLYPVIDRHCWDDPEKLIRCGMLDAFTASNSESSE